MRLRHKLGILGLSALSLMGTMGVNAPSAGADTNTHWLTLSGSVRVKDDEVIARRDKYCTHDLVASDVAQLPQDPTANLNDTNNKCGGEVRVEIKLRGTLHDDRGWCVSGVAELYEGTKDTSGDLDGTKKLEQKCTGPGGKIEYDGRVSNTNEGGDWGDYQIDVLASQ